MGGENVVWGDRPKEKILESVRPNDLAFPAKDSETYGFGFTKREYFAALALGGLAANPNQVDADQESLARAAVDLADMVITVLNAR